MRLLISLRPKILWCLIVCTFFTLFRGPLSWNDIAAFSLTPRASLQKQILVVPCDDSYFDLVMNSLLCWNNIRGAAAIEAFRLFCLSETCCERASSLGLKTLGIDQTGNIYEMFLMHRIGYLRRERNSYLDDLMYTRDHLLSHLLYEGFSVFQADADSCFVEDPFTLFEENELDLLISAQPCLKKIHPLWCNDYGCPGESNLPVMTLNGGIAYFSGVEPMASFVARGAGHGMKISTSPNFLERDGFGQKGFNEEARISGFCFNSTEESANRIWTGKPLFSDPALGNLNVGIFSVCSPCGDMASCEHALAVHSNCSPTLEAKKTFMQQKGVWFLADDWKERAFSLNASRPEDKLEEVLRVIHK